MSAQSFYRRRVIAAIFSFSEFSIQNISLVAIWISKMHSPLRSIVQLISWNIIAKQITAVICKPKLLCYRVPRKTNRISYSLCKNFKACSIGIDTGHRRIWRGRFTYIAWRAYRNIQFSIWTKGYKFWAMMLIGRIFIIYYDRRRRIAEALIQYYPCDILLKLCRYKDCHL